MSSDGPSLGMRFLFILQQGVGTTAGGLGQRERLEKVI